MTKRWWHELAVFDLETTGVDVETSRIVTAHVGIIGASGEILEQWTWLADPEIEIPEGATAVHGVTTEYARSYGRLAPEVVGEITTTLETVLAAGLPLVVYNAPYDLTLLNREAKRHAIRPLVEPRPVIDPLVLDKAVDRYRKGKRTLTVTSEFYGVPLDAAHDAGADAVAAGRVAQAIAKQYADFLGDDVEALHDRQVRWCKAQSLGFQDYMRRTHDPGFTVELGWPERLEAGPALAEVPVELGDGVDAVQPLAAFSG